MIKLTDILNEESYKVAGRPVTLIKGKKSNGTDWKVKFQNGKETSLSDVLSLIKPFPPITTKESVNEASKVVSIANIVRDMLPKEFFYMWKPEDKEKVKAVISDLVKALNRFYKQHNIKVRFTDTDYKYVMYAKEIVEAELHEILNNPLNEDLRKWFGKGKTGSKDGGGWDRYNTSGEKVGKCGDAKEGEPYAACLSQEKAKKLGKDGIAAFVKRKRAAQKKAGDAKKGGEQSKGQKPTFVKTGA